ncbi:endolysin [Klebsiella phage AltoGao]|uniref:Lysozyme n=1 Tax=Klebsiella phage AltoGao TaxID=2026943 RepID=A0A248SL51_9CAUD|nr:endolysin [Klebsiella phage AltoGao]ASV44945.1 endolysin [Klebsiella phage AltoGao]
MLGGAITGVIKHNEGLSLSAYKDSAGVPTICYGETKGVKMGQRASLSDCQKQLIQSAGEHAKALDGLPMQLSDVALVGSIDFIYNVGVAGFNGSTVKRHLKNLNYSAAARAVLDWRYISKYQQKSPGTGWVYKGGNRWTFDCSQYINGQRNRVCWGLWERRQWQSKAIGNQYSSVKEALDKLTK